MRTAMTIQGTTLSTRLLVGLVALAMTSTTVAWSASAGPREQVIASYVQAAPQAASASRGQALFTGTHSGGKPDTPSCTTCHSTNLRAHGKTRAGKDIAPMAPSANPDRFTDAKKVAKWLRRNCKSVLGRECTAQEKADLLTWLAQQ